jgi:hypothetical protein
MYAPTYHFSQKDICLLRYDDDNAIIYSGLFTNFSIALSSSSCSVVVAMTAAGNNTTLLYNTLFIHRILDEDELFLKAEVIIS